MSRLRERDGKADWRRKIAVSIVKTARVLGYGIVIEKLPKHVNEKIINSVRNSELRHRIYQAASRGMVKTIKEAAEMCGVPIREVDPRHTSQTCPDMPLTVSISLLKTSLNGSPVVLTRPLSSLM